MGIKATDLQFYSLKTVLLAESALEDVKIFILVI
jgi:hypothetical protein